MNGLFDAYTTETQKIRDTHLFLSGRIQRMDGWIYLFYGSKASCGMARGSGPHRELASHTGWTGGAHTRFLRVCGSSFLLDIGHDSLMAKLTHFDVPVFFESTETSL